MPARVSRLARAIITLLAAEWAYCWYAAALALKRVDVSPVSVSELGLPADRANMHANSGGPALEAILATLDIPAGSRILDLGCGKGGACFTLAESFAEVFGLDLSPDLIHIARRNAKRLELLNVHFLIGDASTFTDLDDFSHLYLFNPFPIAVARDVVANLRTSLIRRPRPFTIIYKFPGCPAHYINAPDLFSEIHVHASSGHPFHVFRHEA